MHVHLSSEARRPDTGLHVSFHVRPYFVCKSDKFSDETVYLRRLILTFAARICDTDKNQYRMSWLLRMSIKAIQNNMHVGSLQ